MVEILWFDITILDDYDGTNMSKKTVRPEPRLWVILLLGATVVGTGTVFYHIVENLKWLDSVYFSVITLTTIGYGDIVPHTDAGKIFTIFYVLVGIGLLAGVANYLLQHAMVRRWQKRHPGEKIDTHKR